MSQFSGSPQAAIDYNSTVIGALELSEKKWVLAVQLPGVDRHSRHVLDACGEVGFFCRAAHFQRADEGRIVVDSSLRDSRELRHPPSP
jgi:hypothetical protein